MLHSGRFPSHSKKIRFNRYKYTVLNLGPVPSHSNKLNLIGLHVLYALLSLCPIQAICFQSFDIRTNIMVQ